MVSIRIRTDHQVFFPIADWEGIAGAIDRGEIQLEYITLELQVLRKDGGTMTFMDQMEPLVQELCLHASQKLLAEEDFTFHYWNYAGEVQLQVVGGDVAVAGDLIATAKFPLKGLVAGLLGAAGEVMGLMERIHAHFPAYRRPGFEHFQEVMEECRKQYALRYGEPLSTET